MKLKLMYLLNRTKNVNMRFIHSITQNENLKKPRLGFSGFKGFFTKTFKNLVFLKNPILQPWLEG